MSYRQIFRIRNEKSGEMYYRSDRDYCFAGAINLRQDKLMKETTRMDIIHLDNLKELNLEGVGNFFTDSDRELYLQKVMEITGATFTCRRDESVTVYLNRQFNSFQDYPEGLVDDNKDYQHVTSPAWILTIYPGKCKTYVQFKAAITATRYLIEQPYAGLLKDTLNRYKEGQHPDFFVLLQDAHYKNPNIGSDHSWMPINGAWKFLSSDRYRNSLETVTEINNFGEKLKNHHQIFLRECIPELDPSKISRTLNGDYSRFYKASTAYRARPFTELVEEIETELIHEEQVAITI